MHSFRGEQNSVLRHPSAISERLKTITKMFAAVQLHKYLWSLREGGGKISVHRFGGGGGKNLVRNSTGLVRTRTAWWPRNGCPRSSKMRTRIPSLPHSPCKWLWGKKCMSHTYSAYGKQQSHARLLYISHSIFIDCVALAKQGDNGIGSVRPSICLCVCCLCSPVWTVWPMTLIFGLGLS